VGEDDEYYRIKPPADAYLYVLQKYVDPLKQIGENPNATAIATAASPSGNVGGRTGSTPPAIDPTNAATAVAQAPGDAIPNTPASAELITEPAIPKIDPTAAALAEFERLEIDAKAAEGKFLADRPY